MAKIAARDDVASDAKDALTKFGEAVLRHRRASEAAAYVPRYRDAIAAHELDPKSVAGTLQRIARMGESDKGNLLNTFAILMRRAIREKNTLGRGAEMERRFLSVVTRDPDAYDLALSKAKITLAEFYAAILLE